MITDAEILEAWRASSREVGDPMADAQAEQMKARGLDF